MYKMVVRVFPHRKQWMRRIHRLLDECNLCFTIKRFGIWALITMAGDEKNIIQFIDDIDGIKRWKWFRDSIDIINNIELKLDEMKDIKWVGSKN